MAPWTGTNSTPRRRRSRNAIVEEPEAALITLKAEGRVGESVTCSIRTSKVREWAPLRISFSHNRFEFAVSRATVSRRPKLRPFIRIRSDSADIVWAS
jgi:hypothetical protein